LDVQQVGSMADLGVAFVNDWVFVHFPIWFLFLQFSTIIFKGNETPESASGHQVFKIKTE